MTQEINGLKFAVVIRNGAKVKFSDDVPEWWGFGNPGDFTTFSTLMAAQMAIANARNIGLYQPRIVEVQPEEMEVA